jgi:hypothetical protein
LGRLLPVATASPCALFEAYNIGERLGWKGDFWGLLPDRKAAGAMRLLSPSFRGARSASPESIGRHACGEMDSGLDASHRPGMTTSDHFASQQSEKISCQA